MLQLCDVACALALIVLPAGYSVNTTIHVLRNDKEIFESINNVKRGDIVLTYNIKKEEFEYTKIY